MRLHPPTSRSCRNRRPKEAGLIQEHGIHTGNKGVAGVVAPREVPTNHFISDRQEPTIRTLCALDAWFFADAPHPFVGARGRVSRLACLAALEPSRVHVLSAAKE